MEITIDEIVDLSAEAERVLRCDSIVLDVAEPCIIVGDIHGQLQNLCNIFELAGFPNAGDRLLFLGDYVDRGDNSLEVIVYLFALKVLYPDRLFLLRGNHEIRAVNEANGFLMELVTRGLGEADVVTRAFDAVNAAFQWLPIAAVVGERIFAVHGGIGPDLSGVEQIRGLRRPLEVGESGLVTDLLWADPDASVEQFAPNQERRCSVRFGPAVVRDFLLRNGYSRVVRSHQEVDSGCEEPFPGCLTVFSAPNYGGKGNRAAMLRVRGGAEQVVELTPRRQLRPWVRRSDRVRCIFVGDRRSGKSALIAALAGDRPPGGGAGSTYVVKEIDGGRVGLQLWDTLGDDDSRELRVLSYPCSGRRRAVFVVVCDGAAGIRAAAKWSAEIREVVTNPSLLLVCAKAEAARGALAEELRAKAEEIGAAGFLEYSAEGSYGVEKLARAMAAVARGERPGDCMALCAAADATRAGGRVSGAGGAPDRRMSAPWADVRGGSDGEGRWDAGPEELEADGPKAAVSGSAGRGEALPERSRGAAEGSTIGGGGAVVVAPIVGMVAETWQFLRHRLAAAERLRAGASWAAGELARVHDLAARLRLRPALVLGLVLVLVLVFCLLRATWRCATRLPDGPSSGVW